MNYITLTISIASFLLASTQWIYTLYCRRTNYSISVENFEWYEHSNYNRCILTLSIQNLSNAPLIITKMYIANIQCHLSHTWIAERYFPKFQKLTFLEQNEYCLPIFQLTWLQILVHA